MATRPEETEAFCADLLRRIMLENRAKAAEAELARLTALLEDREAIARIITDLFGPEHDERWNRYEFKKAELAVADRLIAYLKGKRVNEQSNSGMEVRK